MEKVLRALQRGKVERDHHAAQPLTLQNPCLTPSPSAGPGLCLTRHASPVLPVFRSACRCAYLCARPQLFLHVQQTTAAFPGPTGPLRMLHSFSACRPRTMLVPARLPAGPRSGRPARRATPACPRRRCRRAPRGAAAWPCRCLRRPPRCRWRCGPRRPGPPGPPPPRAAASRSLPARACRRRCRGARRPRRCWARASAHVTPPAAGSSPGSPATAP